MGLLHRSGVCALALVAGSAALQFEPAVLRNLAIGNASQRITAGAVKVPFWSAAFAQSADTFSLENVSFTFGGATYEAKRIEFSGVTSPRADIEALFSSSSAEPVASRLAKINAKQVTIPELKATQKVGPETQTVVYKNVVFSDIVQGRIASVVIDATAMEANQANGPVLFSYGRTSASELDIPAFARLYETKAGPDQAPLSKIYGAFSIENIDIVDAKQGLDFKIAKIGGRDFMARPTTDSWAGTTALFAELGNKSDPSPEDQGRLMGAVADFLDAFEIGSVEATGIEVKVDPAKAKEKGSPVSTRIGRMAYTGRAGSQPADARIEGLDVSQGDGHVRVATVSSTGFSIRPTLEGLKAIAGKPLDEIDPATMRNLAPTLGTLRLSGLDIDIDAKDSDKGKPERVKTTIKDFELTADKPVNAIPTNVRIGVQNLVMALPSNSTDDFVKEISALGYKTLDASSQIALDWNEATSEITLKEVSLQGQDMGTISLTGLIGNVSKDLFSPDQATAAAALIGAKAKSVDLVVEDKGLLGRYLAKVAKEQKKSPDALRQSYASATSFVVPALLGSSEQAQTLSKAIARFITQPGKLTINAQPKNPSGFGVMEVMLASDPKSVLDKLNIAAKVE